MAPDPDTPGRALVAAVARPGCGRGLAAKPALNVYLALRLRLYHLCSTGHHMQERKGACLKLQGRLL